MRCPECGTANQTAETACPSCGLLLGLVTPPKRREEDLRGLRRRSTDRSLRRCPLCHGELHQDAVRCRHCSEIVDESYRRDRNRRRRANINYAAWVAYLFGLITFVLFRPVGLIAIGAGMLLSILYYAWPETDADPREPVWSRMRRSWKRWSQGERVRIPVPHLRKVRLVFVGTPLLAATIGYFANFLLLQQPMNQVLQANHAFRGMSVSTHYRYWIVPGVVEYDLKAIAEGQTALEVHTALLEYARVLRQYSIRRIDLLFQGERRISIDGAAFQRVGEEYHRRNLEYAYFDFPRLFVSEERAEPEGTQSPSALDALIAFHALWYDSDPPPAR